jgi:hypothetical protein
MLFAQAPQKLAPERFADWLRQHVHNDRRLGHTFQYHPRSDAHSKALAAFIWDDLVARCLKIAQHAASGRIVHRINYRHQWPGSGKRKTIDLAVGPPTASGQLLAVWLSTELKSVMTEHGKSEPRIFDELQSSYRIVNTGNPTAVAAGLTAVNIGGTFVSPTRQVPGQPLSVTRHNQPHVAQRMVGVLRGLPLRQSTAQTGFDAYCTFIVDADNRGSATLWIGPPAPQPGDPDHYETFLQRICDAYTARFP